MSLDQGDIHIPANNAVSGMGLGPAPAESTAPASAPPSTAELNPESSRIIGGQINNEQTTAATSEPESPPRKPEPKLCGVCQIQPGKYKCPRCTMPYCSVACNKTHKENHPPDPVAPTSAEQAAKQATEPTNSNNKSDDDPYKVLLDHAHVFERLFKKYPNLPAALDRIQSTTLPPSDPSAIQSRFPQIPGRQNNQKQNQPWTKDVGLRKGADALRRARTDPSDTGDGVREFCDVVLYLLSTRQHDGKGGTGVIGKVKEEVTREEKSVIERLLREEGGDAL